MAGFSKKDQAEAQENIGLQQIDRANKGTPEAPFFRKPSNKVRLELAREGTKNMLQGRMKKNKASGAEKNARKARNENKNGTKRTTG